MSTQHQGKPLPRAELLGWLEGSSSFSSKQLGRNFIIVDLRRNDFEGGTIKGSLNLPAQTLEQSLETLYTLLTATQVTDVVFYCGSCGGRGTTAAALFASFLAKKAEEQEQPQWLKSRFLEGGIKGWANAGEKYTKWIEGYEPQYWEQFKTRA